jgi:hypothetical protein
VKKVIVVVIWCIVFCLCLALVNFAFSFLDFPPDAPSYTKPLLIFAITPMLFVFIFGIWQVFFTPSSSEDLLPFLFLGGIAAVLYKLLGREKKTKVYLEPDEDEDEGYIDTYEEPKRKQHHRRKPHHRSYHSKPEPEMQQLGCATLLIGVVIVGVMFLVF